MFIDDEQIERFYDAVVRPANIEGPTTYKVSDENMSQVAKKLGAKGGAEAGAKATFGLGSLWSFLGIGTANAEVSAKGSTEASIEKATESGRTTGKTEEIVLNPIHTPQRQLVQLTAHYLLTTPDRYFYVADVNDRSAEGSDWWENEVISRVPRALAFINLPSFQESEEKRLSKTKLIPVAAEFTNGTVVTYFDKIRPKPGTQSCPDHPDIDHPDTYKEMKKAYWNWYVENFEIQPSIELIEKSVQEQKCRIQWIDFRVPIADDGQTLHLHIVAGGRYDTITFAYNFIRRGYEFGLRLIGTLKTDPDMNVLAIYER